MGSASLQCSSTIKSSLFSGHAGSLFTKLESAAMLKFPRSDYVKICLYPCHAYGDSPKVYGGRASALPDVGDFFWGKVPTPLLDMVETPIHLKNLSAEELKQLADEIRSELIFIMSKTQRPFGASLGVVELSVAIHYVFHAPMDKLLWDVGEQTYAHKILTGRRSLMHTLREQNGLSGFTSRAESEYDAFGSGHGCNSVSAGLGN